MAEFLTKLMQEVENLRFRIPLIANPAEQINYRDLRYFQLTF